MVKEVLEHLVGKIKDIAGDRLVGVYLHGSLAMGSFFPERSDIDVIAVTDQALENEQYRLLTEYLLARSDHPFPIEISVLNKEQLQHWKHPCLFDYHFSEDWREHFEMEPAVHFNKGGMRDADLAAHLTILNKRGQVLYGSPIKEVFPFIPVEDYKHAILADYQDCLEDMDDDPVYSILNMLRVYRYLLDGMINSKLEAGEWGLLQLPEYQSVLRKVIAVQKDDSKLLDMQELDSLREAIHKQVKGML